MSSIATQENIQRRRRYCVQDVVNFYNAQTPNRLPKDKEGESNLYRFIYKQISTNGNQLADLIATFEKLGVDILSHIHTKKGKVKQSSNASLDEVVKFCEDTEQLSLLLERLKMKGIDVTAHFPEIPTVIVENTESVNRRTLNDRTIYTARQLFKNGKNGEVVKGENGADLRVAIHKKSRKVYKKVTSNWTDEGHKKFDELFPNELDLKKTTIQ